MAVRKNIPNISIIILSILKFSSNNIKAVVMFT